MTIAAATRAVLLDALGTLVQLEPPAPRLRTELADRFGITVSEGQARQAIAAEIAYYRAHLDEGRDMGRLVALRRQCAEILRAALPPSEQLEAIDGDALTEALLVSLRFTAYEDVDPFLGRLEERGLRAVVVSNWDVSLHGVLERLGVAQRVHGILTSAEAGARKPAAAIFEHALRIARADPRDAIHIGDSLEEDVAGASNAGIAAILVRRDGGAGRPGVPTVTSLAELRLAEPS
jgi:putative hydrolase of the HAD superfamily